MDHSVVELEKNLRRGWRRAVGGRRAGEFVIVCVGQSVSLASTASATSTVLESKGIRGMCGAGRATCWIRSMIPCASKSTPLHTHTRTHTHPTTPSPLRSHHLYASIAISEDKSESDTASQIKSRTTTQSHPTRTARLLDPGTGPGHQPTHLHDLNCLCTSQFSNRILGSFLDSIIQLSSLKFEFVHPNTTGTDSTYTPR